MEDVVVVVAAGVVVVDEEVVDVTLVMTNRVVPVGGLRGKTSL